MTVTRNPAVSPVSNPALAICCSRLSPASWVFLSLLCLYLVAYNYGGVPVN